MSTGADDRPAPLAVGDALAGPLAERPEAEALVARSGRLSYRALDELARTTMGALRAAGVRPGDRVAVSLPNDVDIVGLFHAVMRLGAVWVGVNRALAPPEKAYILDDCAASLYLADAATVAQVAGGRPGLRAVVVEHDGDSEWSALLEDGTRDPGDVPDADPFGPAAVAYTSGTTGYPKGAVHSQHNLMLPGRVLTSVRRYGPSLRKADCFPFTILNLQVLSTLLVPAAGGTAIVMDRVDPVGIAEWLEAERPTTFNGAPAMLYGLATNDEVAPGALRSVDDVWSGGSHCPRVTHERFSAKFGLPIHSTYGATEVPTVVSMVPPPGSDDPDSSGRPLPHLDVRILDGQDHEVPPGATGEICVGPATAGPWAHRYRLMLGYWGRPAATAETLRGGLLHTGDLGRWGDDGQLRVADRRAAMIQRGGASVSPAEVERVLDEIAGVAASCVVGVPDERLGARVVAVVERRPGGVVDPEAARAHCRENLARYKVPEQVLLQPLPRNSMGKVNRAEVERSVASVDLDRPPDRAQTDAEARPTPGPENG